MKNRLSVLSGALVLAVAGSFAVSGTALAQRTLTAVKVAQAPKLEALAADPAWANAPEVKMELVGGANFADGKTTVALKAAYTADRLFVLASWADPTQSVRRSPYQKQPDGTWKKLSDPKDMGGDNNLYYEDKFSFFWNINNSIKEFAAEGCQALCHEIRGGKPKPYGNMYTASEGEIADNWHMKTVRTGYIGQTDDQYVDHTRYNKETAPEAGRKSDPKTGGGYADMKLVNGKPEFMNKDGKAANKGGTYYLVDADKVAFDDSKFVAGDEVASIIVSKFTGDRGDVDTAVGWKNGVWTAVLSRKLVTDGKFDVQFSNLDGEYTFGVAAFDNAAVRHATHDGPMALKFAK